MDCVGLGREGKAGDLMDSSPDGAERSGIGWAGGVAGFTAAARPCRTPANAEAGPAGLGVDTALSSTTSGSVAKERGLAGSAGADVWEFS